LARVSRAIALLFLTVAALASACTSGQRTVTNEGTGAAPSPGGEIAVSMRSEPGNYNRYFEARAATELVALLTQARLAQINRATDALEPALAESWTTSDGLTYTIKLRPGVKFSDGAQFTADDVTFSFKAAFEAPGSAIGQYFLVGGKPVTVAALDPLTVTMTFPQKFAPAMRLLDNLPILPRHKLHGAFEAGKMREAWTPAGPASEVTGLGPFVLTEHVPGQRLVFARNAYYWRRDERGVQLPYLDRLTVHIIPDQNAEALRLESGAIDLMANADIQPADYSRFKQLSAAGRIQLLDGGLSLDPNVLWFNLKPRTSHNKPWLHQKEFRQALSYAADRQAIADTVYLGAAVPIHGPVTPRNATWFTSSAPTYPHDVSKARQLLESIGMRDGNGDGMLEDRAGKAVRFSILVQQGHAIRERLASMLQEQFRAAGVGVDVVGLDGGAIFQQWTKAEYDTILHAFQVSATDPAMTPDFWLSSGPQHVWNPSQSVPATEWERRMDELMLKQTSSSSLEERQQLFAEVQRIFGEQLPALYFVVPKVTIAASPRVHNLQPAPQIPQLLWAADTIAVSASPQKAR
jgi:peptide/nickel transport system substrate-binding protein